MQWVAKIWLEKALKRLVVMLVAWVAGHNLSRFGITIDQTALSVALWALLDGGRNYLKTRFQLKWL